MTTPFVPANKILEELGVTEPRDIRIEAIAQYLGATVVYKSLSGCDARLVGLNDKAIITIDESSPWERQRFSIGHELGLHVWKEVANYESELRLAAEKEREHLLKMVEAARNVGMNWKMGAPYGCDDVAEALAAYDSWMEGKK